MVQFSSTRTLPQRFFAFLFVSAFISTVILYTCSSRDVRDLQDSPFILNERPATDHRLAAPEAKAETQPEADAPPGLTDSGFPKIIWYKLGQKGLNDISRKWTDSCRQANPDHTIEFLDDSSADAHVRKSFAHRPDIVEIFSSLQVPILKADMLRYLLLYDQGGVYLDLDITCESIPIKSQIPDVYKQSAGLVVGWKFDVGWDFSFMRQFASWTIMAKPGSPHMMQAIEDMMDAVRALATEKNITTEQITMQDIGDVVDFSGPRRMTRAIYKSLGKMLDRDVGESGIKEILQPTMIGDVLVMPGRSFASSSNKYKPEEEDSLPPKLGTHEYAGSWKNDRGGELS